jgi:hypothetical protein
VFGLGGRRDEQRVVSDLAVSEVEKEEVVLCAWCLREQGRGSGEGSHGICLFHARQMMAQYRQLRRK